jgi:hypothetical protein
VLLILIRTSSRHSSRLIVDDIVDMPAFNNNAMEVNNLNNYIYSPIGELIADNKEEILEISWRVDSKIAEITRTPGSSKLNLKFQYDALGNRVAKHTFSAAGNWRNSEFYVRDASGNIMATYKHYPQAQEMHYQLTERHIYGAARIGTENATVDLIANYTEIDFRAFSRTINLKSYEISNHLGNVISTVSDLKIPVDISNDNFTDSYSAIIISATDYSPFGAALDNRSFNKEEYRFGFNGQEMDKEVSESLNITTALFWEYDARIARRWNIDLQCKEFNSSYLVFSNCPSIMMDPSGNDDYFNEKGEFVGSDGQGGNKAIIRYINTTELDSYRNKDGSINWVRAKSKSEPLSKFLVDKAQGRMFRLAVYRRIGQYYATKIGYTGEVGLTVNKGDVPMSTEKGAKIINLNCNFDPKGYSVLDDIDNVMFLMMHELMHVNGRGNDFYDHSMLVLETLESTQSKNCTSELLQSQLIYGLVLLVEPLRGQFVVNGSVGKSKNVIDRYRKIASELGYNVIVEYSDDASANTSQKGPTIILINKATGIKWNMNKIKDEKGNDVGTE